MGAGLLLLTVCDAALAKRYALLIGANRGIATDGPLRYAVDDAQRVADVLSRLGGVSADDMILLSEPRADDVRAALSRLNQRIGEQKPSASLLLVYYSGHADAEGLHLNKTVLPWRELRTATGESPARARVLVVDACQSGEATRVKGGALVAPFALPKPGHDVPEGMAILSSAAVGESALESDTLKGSFFTHHLLTALLGVGDSDDDGRVTLSEAYRYAADRTVAGTARTSRGAQHPTYAVELRGRQELVLTQRANASGAGALRLSWPGAYMIRAADDDEGSVVAEVLVGAEARTLWLSPQRYAVEHRGREQLYVYEVEVARGRVAELDPARAQTLAYNVSPAKGGDANWSMALMLWGGVESATLAEFSPPLYAAASIEVDLPAFSFEGRAELTVAGAERHQQVVIGSFVTGLAKYLHWWVFRLGFGLRGGAAIYFQANTLLTPRGEAVLRADVRLPLDIVLALEGGARIERLIVDGGARGTLQLAQGSGFGHVGVGYAW